MTPSKGDRLFASTGDCSPAALASLNSETALKKLYPTSGHISSSIVHRARPLRISHSSLISSGLRGASWTRNASCERKKDVLQIANWIPGSRAKIIQCPNATNTAIRKQNETVTNALGIHQLMNRKDEGTALGGFIAQHFGHRADLSEGEAIKRFGRA